MSKIILSSLVALTVINLASCSDDDPALSTEEEEHNEYSLLLGEAANDNIRVRLYGNDNPTVGYNKILADVRSIADNSVPHDLSVELTPLMTMPSMMHSAPFESIHDHERHDDHIFGLVFMMPSGEMNEWTLNVKCSVDQQSLGEFAIPLQVVPSSYSTMLVPSDGNSLVVTLLQPEQWTVGMNDIEFTIHERTSMMSFPAREDLELQIEPDMPAMGHGSPNNENPLHVQNGHYHGRVNFTMTGEWSIVLHLKRGGQEVAKHEFFVTVR